ncbi:unnamed protein product [Bursaphelenchus xylophilus]|uniref:(pine wood nematode) hypothetical protein n=1 Tax=Bursaphelenchus xylophilus TaxID=6326 RepID=A0A7I8WG46_BURXY|nr:unnamed protein product [Bursaphelenchus xylophilus]CAG9111812.1 unnamed protein product [Bursaphelenchus xylophilus]
MSTQVYESSNSVNGLFCLISEEMQSLSSSSDVDSANKALRRHTHASSALMINVITRGSARPTQRQMEQPKVSQNMSEAGTSGSGEFGRPESDVTMQLDKTRAS